ncbi:hypothetical protein [Mesorhizobium sp.]|nr:hypothetical protein [Mesorhizobium sp.]
MDRDTVPMRDSYWKTLLNRRPLKVEDASPREPTLLPYAKPIRKSSRT